MSYDTINLIRLLYAWFYNSHHCLLNQHMFLQKRIHSSFKMYFMRVVKYTCLIYIKYTCNVGKVTRSIHVSSYSPGILRKYLLLVLNPTKTNLEHENKGFWTNGQSGVPCNFSNRTFELEVVHPPKRFR
jgi:hypothetical protein